MFDIKNDRKEAAPHGPDTGRELNGKFATARSAGNYLAGYNAATSTYFKMHISEETFMKMGEPCIKGSGAT